MSSWFVVVDKAREAHRAFLDTTGFLSPQEARSRFYKAHAILQESTSTIPGKRETVDLRGSNWDLWLDVISHVNAGNYYERMSNLHSVVSRLSIERSARKER